MKGNLVSNTITASYWNAATAHNRLNTSYNDAKKQMNCDGRCKYCDDHRTVYKQHAVVCKQ